MFLKKKLYSQKNSITLIITSFQNCLFNFIHHYRATLGIQWATSLTSKPQPSIKAFACSHFHLNSDYVAVFNQWKTQKVFPFPSPETIKASSPSFFTFQSHLFLTLPQELQRRTSFFCRFKKSKPPNFFNLSTFFIKLLHPIIMASSSRTCSKYDANLLLPVIHFLEASTNTLQLKCGMLTPTTLSSMWQLSHGFNLLVKPMTLVQ